jgi:hypothetical protein
LTSSSRRNSTRTKRRRTTFTPTTQAYLEEALQVSVIEITEVVMKTVVATMMKSGLRGGGGFRQTDPILVLVDRPFGIVIM